MTCLPKPVSEAFVKAANWALNLRPFPDTYSSNCYYFAAMRAVNDFLSHFNFIPFLSTKHTIKKKGNSGEN